MNEYKIQNRESYQRHAEKKRGSVLLLEIFFIILYYELFIPIFSQRMVPRAKGRLSSVSHDPILQQVPRSL